MNWSAVPRDDVEVAAANGDLDAQAELRIHEALDRIEGKVRALRTALTASFDKIDSELDDIKRVI